MVRLTDTQFIVFMILTYMIRRLLQHKDRIRNIIKVRVTSRFAKFFIFRPIEWKFSDSKIYGGIFVVTMNYNFYDIARKDIYLLEV